MDKGVVSIFVCQFSNELLLFSWFSCIFGDVDAGVSESRDTISDGTAGSWVDDAFVILSGGSSDGTAFPTAGGRPGGAATCSGTGATCPLAAQFELMSLYQFRKTMIGSADNARSRNSVPCVLKCMKIIYII